MEVEEICRKLKPLLGRRADQYLQAYLAEDYKGKAELKTALELMSSQVLNQDLERPSLTLSAPPEALACGPYPLGTVMYAWRPLYGFGLREDEWIQHVAIFGRSGAGKTNAIVVLVRDLMAKGKPFVIFDWKRNYRDLLAIPGGLLPDRGDQARQDIAVAIAQASGRGTTPAEIRPRSPPSTVRADGPPKLSVYTVGRDIVPFSFNPLIPPPGTDPSTWLKKLIEIIAHAYFLGEGVMYLLQEALHAIYSEAGMYDAAGPQRHPVLRDVLQWLVKHPVKGRQAQWMDSTLRGVQSLCFGHMGNVINATDNLTDVGALLERQVILELDALTSADKTFLIEALLLWIHHYRLAQGRRETFKHALIIEEAHHILLRRTAGRGGEAITDTILREIRELGEAVVLVDQHPSLISIPALGNTYTTIAMNLKHKADVSAVGAAMLLEDEGTDLLGQLPVGWAIVKLQGRWTQAFVVSVPHLQLPKGSVTDGLLSQMFGASRTAADEAAPSPDKPPVRDQESSTKGTETRALSNREEGLLRDVADHPLSGVVERYRRLGLNRRKGNAAKEACLAQGLLQQVPIPTRGGRVVLLEPTVDGLELLKARGFSVGKLTPHIGGLEHEYWRAQVAGIYKSQGYQVRMEHPVNGYADLVAERDGMRLALEIETGKSNWKDNIARDLARFDQVTVVCTNELAYEQIVYEAAQRWSAARDRLKVLRAQEL